MRKSEELGLKSDDDDLILGLEDREREKAFVVDAMERVWGLGFGSGPRR